MEQIFRRSPCILIIVLTVSPDGTDRSAYGFISIFFFKNHIIRAIKDIVTIMTIILLPAFEK